MTTEHDAAALRIGGFLPFTMVDYPDALAAIIFCQGCPLNCVYCHNQALRPATIPVCRETAIDWKDVHAHLIRRSGLLDAVVFSGGEPLMQGALRPAMTKAKDLGYRIGLHTSGIAPQRLRELLPLLDWVGFDVKAPFDRYQDITGVIHSGDKARQSLAMLINAGIDVEARTTIWPGQVDADEIDEISTDLTRMGVQHFALQEARDPQTGTPKGGAIFAEKSPQISLAGGFETFIIRRAA